MYSILLGLCVICGVTFILTGSNAALMGWSMTGLALISGSMLISL